MSRGSRVPARRPAGRLPPAIARSTIRCCGVFTFAESPEVAAPDARIIWHASLDPGTLTVRAEPAPSSDPDAVDPACLSRWLTVVVDGDGREHAVLSDGKHHLRLDLEAGSLASEQAVILHYHLYGIGSATDRVLTLRRLHHLLRYHRFSRALYPLDRRVPRAIVQLRVRDALQEGASIGDIAAVLFGSGLARDARRSDSLRSRVRRLIHEARHLAAGGFRNMLRER